MRRTTVRARADLAPPFRGREIVTDVPRTVWLVTAAFALVCACYAFLVPTYRAPDEPAHVDVVYALRTGDGFAAPGERAFTPEVRGTVVWYEFADTNPTPRPPEEARVRTERPSFSEVDPVPNERHNWVTNHPPLYYGVEAAVLWLTPGVLDWNFDQVVGWLRLSNVLLLVPLPVLVHAVARRLTTSRAVAVAAAAFCFAVPQLVHVTGSVNNDNLLNVLAALLTLVGIAIGQGDLSRRTALWAGVVLGLALLTKGFALALVGWLGLAYLLGWARRRGPLPWVPGLLALGLAFVVGGWWWLRNLLVHGSVQPSGAPPLEPLEGPRASAVDYWVDMFGRWMAERLWGSFGFVDTPIPLAVAVGATAVVVLGLLLALVLPGRHGERRLDLVLAPLPAALSLVLVTAAAWAVYARTGIPAGIQGRYLYTGLAGVAATALVGYGKVLGRAERALPMLVLAGGVVLHWVSVVTVLGRYWGDEVSGPVEEALRAVIAWSPWDGIWLVALAAVTAAAVAATFLSAVADASRRDAPEPAPAGSAASSGEEPTRVGGHRRS